MLGFVRIRDITAFDFYAQLSRPILYNNIIMISNEIEINTIQFTFLTTTDITTLHFYYLVIMTKLIHNNGLIAYKLE